MTIRELFRHFVCYFYNICYFDKKNNVEDCFMEGCGIPEDRNEKFMELYGERPVENWDYEFHSNTIFLEL